MSLLENAVFNYSWEVKSDISMLGTVFPITISADAYYETEKPTVEQEESFCFFMRNKEEILGKIDNLLISDTGSMEEARRRYVPKMLKIKKNGDCGLLLDDENNFENGLVVTIRPTYGFLDTDEYL